MAKELLRKFRIPFLLLFIVLVSGTTGYWFIGDGKYSVLDCFYMTVITILTIGYGEIIDLNAMDFTNINGPHKEIKYEFKQG